MAVTVDDQDSELYSDLDSTPSRAHHSSTFTSDDDIYEPGSLSTLTSFDAYFLHASRPSRTSSNVFSHLVQPLSADEYAASLSRSFYTLPFSDDALASAQSTQVQAAGQGQGSLEAAAAHRAHFPRYLLELAEGFNLLFYGFGSKRRVLNALARACASGHGRVYDDAYHGHAAHILVLNGFLPSFSVRDIIAALEHLPGAPQNVQGVAQFLSSSDPSSPSSYPSPTSSGHQQSTKTTKTINNQGQQRALQQRRRRLVLVVHNIDAPALRAPKVRALLGALAALSGVQLAASVDHINAPLLWTSTELLAGKWLWHDLTTLAAYDAELAGADPASLRGAPALRASGAAAAEAVGIGMAGRGGGQMIMTETAAGHVLAAVTQRARKLFVLMGRRQLDVLADAGGSSSGGGAVVDPTTPAEAVEVAIAYDMLFNLARDHFVATNDTALRALLGEFKDHGLIVTVGTGVMGSGEMLWIPLRKERLTKLLDGLEPAL